MKTKLENLVEFLSGISFSRFICRDLSSTVGRQNSSARYVYSMLTWRENFTTRHLNSSWIKIHFAEGEISGNFIKKYVLGVHIKVTKPKFRHFFWKSVFVTFTKKKNNKKNNKTVLVGIDLGSLASESRALSITPRRLWVTKGILIYIKFRTGEEEKKNENGNVE